ncbi:MAG: sel1 repeat family protein [Holosporales bacterium]|nr:sel1 repeat family protein [Holosporales bacterium]
MSANLRHFVLQCRKCFYLRIIVYRIFLKMPILLSLVTLSLPASVQKLSPAEVAENYKRFADINDVHGLYNYGVCLEEGRGVLQDLNLAVNYFRRAADMGNPLAVFRYGLYLRFGIGIQQNVAQSRIYLQCAEASGYSGTPYNGLALHPQIDYTWGLAARQGDGMAQYNYAMFLQEGNEADKDEALYYFQEARKQGWPPSWLYKNWCAAEPSQKETLKRSTDRSPTI